MAKKSNSNTYSIDFRTRTYSGAWGRWVGRGYGDWLGVEHLKNQLRMLIKSTKYSIEISVLKDGQLIGINGEVIKSPLVFEKNQ